MTSISSATTPVLDSRTIGRLFGAKADEATGDTGASGSTTTPTDPILAIASGSRVAGTTSGAIASLALGTDTTAQAANAVLKASALKADPSDPASRTGKDAKAGTSSDQPALRAGEEYAVVNTNTMTSQQISDALYGAGLPTEGTLGQPTTTFRDFLADNRDDEAWHFQQANNSSRTDADRQEFLADATRIKAQNDAMEAAYNNHTLTFTNAHEIQGLDDNEMIATGQSGSGVSTVSWTRIAGDFNHEFLAKNNNNGQSNLAFFGGASIYMTW